MVAGGFLAVRALVWLTGGRFSTSLLDIQPQLLDRVQLAADPFGAAWRTHIQPPLYNLVVGVVLRWSPWPPGLSFQVLWVACGAVTALALFGFLLELGTGWRLAAGVALAVAALDPYLLAFEHTLTYETPVTALVTVSAWGVARYARTGSWRDYALFAGAATATVLTRSLFHPFWLLLVLVGVLLLRRPASGWPVPAATAATALVLVGVVMAQHQALSGSWELSSFAGMNLQRSVIGPLPPATVRRMVADGTVSREATIDPFSAYADYQPLFGPCRSSSRDPVLASPVKRAGFANYDADCYLPAYRRAQRDALAALRAEPGRYLGTRVTAASIFLNEQDGIGARSPVTTALRHVGDAVLLVVPHRLDMRGWQASPGGLPGLDLKVSLTAAASIVVALGLGLRAAWRRRPGGEGASDPADLARLYVAITLAAVLALGLTTELGENGRFRMVLDPLLLGLLAVTVAGWLRAGLTRRRGAHAG